MKKLCKLCMLLLAVTALAFTLTACGGSSDPQPTPTPSVSTSPSTAPTEVTSEFFTLSGTTFSVTVPNSQATLELSDKFNIPQGVSAILCKAMYGGDANVILSSTLVSLNEGENEYSLVVTMPTGFPQTYAVVITRNPTYAVYFNTQGSSVETQYVENGLCATQPTQNPTRAGYTFTGWDYDFTTPVTQSITVNAQWQANLNTLSFNPNGATAGNMQLIQIRSGESATLPNATFTKTGYTFLGWATSADGAVVYENGETYTMGTESEYTLYAVWQENYTEGLSFTKRGDAYYVSDYLGASTTVTIPVKYMGYPVTSIGSEAFYSCDSLTEIVIPDSVISIGSQAFNSCDSLTEIVIPDSVTSIGSYAFCNCSSLTTVTFGDNSQLTSIGAYAFYNCYSLTEIVIPNSVTSIGERAFYSCYSLTEIVIPESVTSIGSWAFYDCDSLTEIVIPDSVTSIGDYAFSSCYSLTKITFSDTSTWYRTTDEGRWNAKTGGTETNVTTPTQNATYFGGTYYNYYWYKL